MIQQLNSQLIWESKRERLRRLSDSPLPAPHRLPCPRLPHTTHTHMHARTPSSHQLGHSLTSAGLLRSYFLAIVTLWILTEACMFLWLKHRCLHAIFFKSKVHTLTASGFWHSHRKNKILFYLNVKFCLLYSHDSLTLWVQPSGILKARLFP